MGLAHGITVDNTPHPYLFAIVKGLAVWGGGRSFYVPDRPTPAHAVPGQAATEKGQHLPGKTCPKPSG